MVQVISESKPKARKDYWCMASEFLTNGDIRDCTFTFTEWRYIVKAKRNNWKVKKGEIYTRQACTDGGHLLLSQKFTLSAVGMIIMMSN